MGNDIRELFGRASDEFGRRVHAVGDDQWDQPTPCTDWDVHQLVNHLVSETRWMPHLLAGQTIEEVGDRYEGDVLGGDPKTVWDESSKDAAAAVNDDGAMERTVHLSFGDFPGAEYTWQVFTDLLIHGWDLARGIGADDTLDPELVEACARWFDDREELYRGGGAIADRQDVGADADPQTVLLARFGRKR